MFKSISDLVELANFHDKKIYEIMIDNEMKVSGKSYEEIMSNMSKNYDVMENAINDGLKGVTSKSGMSKNNALKLNEYIKAGNFITDETLLKASCYAIATNEINASMGIICATPTAGSAGVLPGVLFALKEKLDLPKDIIIKHLFTAGAFGYVIANNGCISGAAGGCQAEIGSASAMAAGAVVELMGGTPSQCANGMALALKNMLGLTCDPVAGLVEVPCIKRNSAGAINAITSAELALAGLESLIPWDEVIIAMTEIGKALPNSLKETSQGGLSTTKTGEFWRDKLTLLQ